MTVEIFLVTLVGAMAIGVPVAFSLIVCGLALMLYMGIFDSQIVALKLIEGADNFQLLALPFFLLAGELMNAGGLSKRIIAFAISLVGCQVVGKSNLRGIDTQGPRNNAARRYDIADCRIKIGKNGTQFLNEAFTRLAQTDTARGPIDQRHSKAGFKLCYCLAQSRC
jgi:hypothetical protein